jgi:hypothetical protein
MSESDEKETGREAVPLMGIAECASGHYREDERKKL